MSYDGVKRKAHGESVKTPAKEEREGALGCRCVTVGPKCNAVLWVLAVIGGTALVCGVVELGGNLHGWSIAPLQLAPVYSIVLIGVGSACVVARIVCRKNTDTVGLKVKKPKKELVQAENNTKKSTSVSMRGATSVSTSRLVSRPGGTKKERVALKASIAMVHYEVGGLIDEVGKKILSEDLWIQGFRAEEGSPISVEVGDSAMEFKLFAPTVGKLDLELTGLVLPLKLFEGKKDGDSIRLRYREKLIELKIDQPALFPTLREGENTFEYFKEVHQAGLAMDPKPYMRRRPVDRDPYRIGQGGMIYRLARGEGDRYRFTPSERQELQPVGKEAELVKLDSFHKEANGEEILKLVIDFPGFGEQQDPQMLGVAALTTVDFILNEEYLIVYGRNPHLNGKVNEKYAMYKWKNYVKLSLEQMKARLSGASAFTRNGVVEILIPMNEAQPIKI